MRLIPLAAASALLALSACNTKPAEPEVTVDEAWVQLPAVPGRPGAAYFTLSSNNDPTRLIGIASPRVQRIELHGTVTEQGITRMRPLEAPLFTGSKLDFAPGGNHAMLFDLDPALKAGDKVPLTFTFDTAPAVTVEAEVRAFGEGHAGH
ncbi:MAG: copper chaperone PCu(A)C [Sphingosinicella sp.]|nr:copper chaperone PCu(A)C [Sphingosinicella sp.]